MDEIDISKIKIEKRIRKEANDVDDLLASFEEVGLLCPVVLRSDNRLVDGERRIRAFQSLGKKTIPYVIADTLEDARQFLVAERDANVCRKDFTPEEKVRFAERFEVMEREAAKKRQETHGGTAPGKPKNTSGKFPEVITGQTRDKVGEIVGWSGPTYQRAKAVVNSDNKEAIKVLNDTGKVTRAYAMIEPPRSNGTKNRKGKTGAGMTAEQQLKLLKRIRRQHDETKVLIERLPQGKRSDRLIDSLTQFKREIDLYARSITQSGDMA